MKTTEKTLSVFQKLPDLKCSCGASAKNTSKERGRFLRRHFGSRPVCSNRSKVIKSVLTEDEQFQLDVELSNEGL